MACFVCTCGHTQPLDATDLPYEASAYVLRDQNADELWEAVYQNLAGFAAALATNGRADWIREQLGEQYPQRLADRDVLEDALIGHFGNVCLVMFQCEQCGRLWVQEKPATNRYRSFRPDGEWRDTLAVQKTASAARNRDPE